MIEILILAQVERRVAPFWRGLNDHCESWTEHQLVAVARGRPLPAADEIPEEEFQEAPKNAPEVAVVPQAVSEIDSLTVPISSRAQSFASDGSSNASPISGQFPPILPSSPTHSSSIGSALSRGRAKTLASLTEASKDSQPDMKPREVQLPRDPNVNGQPVEAYLYKDAVECPICFLFYPKFLNKTRCCDQAICTECFVQIKRPDPHPPEHHSEPGQPHIDAGAASTGNEDDLVSEPAQCPYCNQPEFGITYESPPFRRGLVYPPQPSTYPFNLATPAMSSSSSLASGQSTGDRVSSPSLLHRRTVSMSAADPLVITTDRVRPDWHHKLVAARSHMARRSAAATALHTAAYLMGTRGHESDGRPFGAFGRRNILRRASGPDAPSGSSSSNQAQLNMLAMMSERYATYGGSRVGPPPSVEGDPSSDASVRTGSRRRRVEDVEEMMMMEAIRLSLASEEDRRKREEKEAKKEAKKKDKENKKADKIARKGSAGGPTETIGKGKSAEQNIPFSPSTGSLSSVTYPHTHLERARQQILPNESSSLSNATPHRPSHLRNLSNASSLASSTGDSPPTSIQNDSHEMASSLDASPHGSSMNLPTAPATQDNYLSRTPPAGGSMEPMFNFHSLAAMVGEDGGTGDDKSAKAIVQMPQAEQAAIATNAQPNDDEANASTAAFSKEPSLEAAVESKSGSVYTSSPP